MLAYYLGKIYLYRKSEVSVVAAFADPRSARNYAEFVGPPMSGTWWLRLPSGDMQYFSDEEHGAKWRTFENAVIYDARKDEERALASRWWSEDIEAAVQKEIEQAQIGAPQLKPPESKRACKPKDRGVER